MHADRLRHRERRGRQRPDGRRARPGHAVLHVARAGGGHARLRRHRRVGGRAHAVRAAHRGPTRSRQRRWRSSSRSSPRAPSRSPRPVPTCRPACAGPSTRPSTTTPRDGRRRAELRDRLLRGAGGGRRGGGSGASGPGGSGQLAFARTAKWPPPHRPRHPPRARRTSRALRWRGCSSRSRSIPPPGRSRWRVIAGNSPTGRPLAAVSFAGLVCIPAFWNYAEAAGLVWAGLCAAWIWAGTHWGGSSRLLAPLAGHPAGLAGLGPAFVLIAATAPTAAPQSSPKRPRAQCIALTAGGLVPAAAARAFPVPRPAGVPPGAGRAPEAIACRRRHDRVRGVLLAVAWNGRRAAARQAVAVWGIGFGLAMIAVPPLSGSARGGVQKWPWRRASRL